MRYLKCSFDEIIWCIISWYIFTENNSDKSVNNIKLLLHKVILRNILKGLLSLLILIDRIN